MNSSRLPLSHGTIGACTSASALTSKPPKVAVPHLRQDGNARSHNEAYATQHAHVHSNVRAVGARNNEPSARRGSQRFRLQQFEVAVQKTHGAHVSHPGFFMLASLVLNRMTPRRAGGSPEKSS